MVAFQIVISFALILLVVAVWLITYRVWKVLEEMERFFSLLSEEGEPLLQELEQIISKLEMASTKVEERVSEASEGFEGFLATVDDSRARLEELVVGWQKKFSPENIKGARAIELALSLYSYINRFRSKSSKQEEDNNG